MGKKSIHSYVRAQVVALHDATLNQLQISERLKVSWCCIQTAINKYKQFGRFDDLKHTERPKKLFCCEIRRLKRLVKVDSHLRGLPP